MDEMDELGKSVMLKIMRITNEKERLEVQAVALICGEAMSYVVGDKDVDSAIQRIKVILRNLHSFDPSDDMVEYAAVVETLADVPNIGDALRAIVATSFIWGKSKGFTNDEMTALAAIVHGTITDLHRINDESGDVPSQEDEKSEEQPTTNKVYRLWREGGYAQTNVPRHITRHSPTGFEWGYGGSGPADLALNILEDTLRDMGYRGPRRRTKDGEEYFSIIDTIGILFKDEVIANLDHDADHSIDQKSVVQWIKEHM